MAIQKFRCCGCDDLHDDESDARDCCEPTEAWVCEGCDVVYGCEDLADKCCEGADITDKCPACARDYNIVDLNHSAITVAGHCQTCNPHYTIDQQFAIEDMHLVRTGRRERLNA